MLNLKPQNRGYTSELQSTLVKLQQPHRENFHTRTPQHSPKIIKEQNVANEF